MVDRDVLVLGAGVAGLAAAWSLGERACVLERERRAGGLVRTEQLAGYWFDHVLHLLHFSDSETEARLRGLLGGVLQPCPPEAWVECSAGTARYPVQSNLGSLDHDVVIRCLSDFAREAFRGGVREPRNHREMLLQTFGRELCELFFFPYQRKMWKRPLAELAPSGFQWNISRPSFEELLRGALHPQQAEDPHDPSVYNQNGWYPRPSSDAPVRGMEVLTRELLKHIHDLRLEHDVISLDPEARRVRALHRGNECSLGYRTACISTLPLPRVVRMCTDSPPQLLNAVSRLAHNRVRSVMLGIRGSRPKSPGLWRHFADDSVVFSRVAFMTEFDPLNAPADGFGLLAEVTERAEDPPRPGSELVECVVDDLRRLGWLRASDELVVTHVVTADPAYVVFSPGNQEVLEETHSFLRARGIEPLGRYGRWEYSSMEAAIRDGLRCGEALASSHALGCNHG